MTQTITPPPGLEQLYEDHGLTTPLTEDLLARMPPHELKRELLRHITAARAILERATAERRARTAAEEAELRRLEGEMDKLEAAQAAAAAGDAVERRAQRIGLSVHDGLEPPPRGRERTPLARWVDRKTGKEIRTLRPDERLADTIEATPEQRGLRVGKYLRGLITGKWDGAEAEQRAVMTIAQATGGGNLLPTPLAAYVIDLARNRSVVFKAGSTLVPMTAPTLDLARITADPTGQWFGGDEVRLAGITESQATFGRVQLQAQTLAFLERISIELAEDAPNFPDLLENQLGAAIALELDRAVLFGIPGGVRVGLRDWITIGGDSSQSINETSMGTNGATPTDFSQLVTVIRQVLDGNYPGRLDELSGIMSPRSWGTYEGLKNTLNDPLRSPASWAAIQAAGRVFVTKQCPITEAQGSSNAASTVFVGDFTQVLLGMRTEMTIELSREAGDAFQRLHVLLRGYLRADWSVAQPKWISRLVGLI